MDRNKIGSEIQIIYSPKLKASQMPMINSPEAAYQIAFEKWDKGMLKFVEQFKVLMLNANSRLIGIYEASRGGISGTVVDPKVIFIAALKSCASCIILIHNHPSGNLKASKADHAITEKIKKGGVLLDIAVIDHLIISEEGYTSFSDEGWL